MTAAAVATGNHLFWITSRAAGIVLALFPGRCVQMASGHDPALGTSSAQVAGAPQDTAPMTTSAS